MRYLVWIIILLLPSVSSGYSPPAVDLLGKMEAAWQRMKPVQIHIVLETADGRLLEENMVSVPIRIEPESFHRRDILKAGYLPFAYLTSNSDILNQLLPSLHRNDTKVRLARIDDTICFVVEGSDSRLWLRKDDLFPLRSEIRMDNGQWVTCRYLDPVQVSEKVAYPGRTEVFQEREPILTERLIEQQPEPFSQ